MGWKERHGRKDVDNDFIDWLVLHCTATFEKLSDRNLPELAQISSDL